MNYNLAQTLFWIFIFLVLALLPTVIALSGTLPPERKFWVELGALLGFLGLAILNLQFVITGRFRWFANGFGLDNLLQFHKQMGIFALLLVLAHPGILFVADPVFLEYLDPRVNFPRAVSLSFVTVAAVVLIASSLWRLTFRLSYEKWRLLHGVLAFAILVLGLGHVLMVDHYGAPFWKKGAFVAMSGAAMYLVFHSRLVRPLLMRRKPYRISEVRSERNQAWTLVIEPEGHRRMNFRPGQFVWLTVGDTPFSLQQHPFSIASSPRQEKIELSVKELGDFTDSVREIPPGMRAWLEGPYGSFYTGREASGLVFIAGGIGITPIMSHLRTAREKGSRQPLILIFGNATWDDVTFREEIAAMEKQIPLKVVHVLEKPPKEWTGETGFIDRKVLDRHLPENVSEYEYFVCGPEAMMDLTEPILKEMGIPCRAIHSERFEMV